MENAQCLKSIGRQGSNFYKKDASEVRDQFKEYFIKPEGEVPWQKNYISFNGNLGMTMIYSFNILFLFAWVFFILTSLTIANVNSVFFSKANDILSKFY